MNIRLLPLFSALFLLACTNSGDTVQTEKAAALPPIYYYYPRANVYFDSANKEYLFMGSSDTSWQTAKQIPAVVQALMDKQVLIDNPSQPVWRDNANHKLVYSALLYATANDTVAKKEPPKLEAKPKPSNENDEKKERKGLRKFLDKIFGKDKKKKDTSDESQ